MNIRFYPGVQNFGIDTTFMLGTFKPVLLSEWQTSWVDSIHFSELRAASAEGLLTFQTSKNPALHEKTGFQYHLTKKVIWPSLPFVALCQCVYRLFCNWLLGYFGRNDHLLTVSMILTEFNGCITSGPGPVFK